MTMYKSKTRLKVNIEDIKDMVKVIKEINEWDLENIEVMKNGKVLPKNERAMYSFKFTGLNNMDYIKMFCLD